MAIVAKSITELLEDLADSLALYGSEVKLDSDTLNDMNQGAKLKILSRAFARALSEVWRSLAEVERDSNIATATGFSLDLLVNTFGMSRKPGRAAVGNVIALPKGSAVTDAVTTDEIFLANGGTFLATGARTLAAPYARIPVESGALGDDWNLSAGTPLRAARKALDDKFFFYVGDTVNVATGALDGSLAQGADVEDDDSLRERFVDYIQSLSRATYKAVLQAVRSIPGVKSVQIIENVPMVGFFTVYLDDGSANPLVPESLVAEVERVLFDWRACGVGVKVRAMEKVAMEVELNVKLDGTVIPTAAKNEIEANLLASLSEYAIGEVLYTSRLIDIAHNTVGVDSVSVVKPEGARVDILAHQVFRPKAVKVNVTV